MECSTDAVIASGIARDERRRFAARGTDRQNRCPGSRCENLTGTSRPRILGIVCERSAREDLDGSWGRKCSARTVSTRSGNGTESLVPRTLGVICKRAAREDQKTGSWCSLESSTVLLARNPAKDDFRMAGRRIYTRRATLRWRSEGVGASLWKGKPPGVFPFRDAFRSAFVWVPGAATLRLAGRLVTGRLDAPLQNNKKYF